MKIIFELKEVSLYFEERPVLVNINAKFPQKQITCLIGTSGAGKTTLLKTLNRINDFTPSFRCEGNVTFDSVNIYSPELDVNQLRQKVVLVFQEPCVFPRSIYDNAIFGLRYLGRVKKSSFPEIAEQMLRAVFLWDDVKDRLHKPAKELSLGQQQRLCIARALAIKPQVLLLDEPTSSLDIKSQEAIEELCRTLKENSTIIMAIHKLEQVKRIADNVISIP